ncbi:MAG: hypothetical protein ACFFDO_05420 [Candidatus Thorarchaeota archaeon]
MALTPIESLIGLFSLIFSIIATIIGLLIASKYRKYKQNTLLYVGLSLPGLAFPWYPSSISFLTTLMIDQSLSPEWYFLIGNAFLPIALFFWILALTELILKKKQKIILIIYSVIGIIFEIYFFYSLFTAPNVIGELKGPVDVEYYGITRLYLIFVVLTIIVTGLLFVIECLKSGNPEIKLKGIFLQIAVILYTIGAVADGFMTLTFVTLPIIRIILISSIIMFYNGWILPESVKKLFLKQK